MTSVLPGVHDENEELIDELHDRLEFTVDMFSDRMNAEEVAGVLYELADNLREEAGGTVRDPADTQTDFLTGGDDGDTDPDAETDPPAELLEDERVSPEAREAFEELCARAASDNWFSVLGVHWSAHSGDVERAKREAFALLEQCEELRRRGPMVEYLLQFAEARIRDAHSFLMVDEVRRHYRESVIDDRVRESYVAALENKVEDFLQSGRDDRVFDDYLKLKEIAPDSPVLDE
ncbi:MAG: hypothetical protein ABEL76_11880 [Bradymonadaceae bacterium]